MRLFPAGIAGLAKALRGWSLEKPQRSRTLRRSAVMDLTKKLVCRYQRFLKDIACSFSLPICSARAFLWPQTMDIQDELEPKVYTVHGIFES